VTIPTPAVAPYVPNYATYTPYITPEEFLQSATGVDSSQLVPKGTTAQNNAALATVIARASNYADNLCNQVLAATVDVQVGEYRMFRDGTIRVPVDNTPLIEVNAVSVGYAPGALTALTDLSGLWITRKVVRIPVTGVNYPSLSGRLAATSIDGRLFAQVSYVNGWANTTLASAVAAGATSITVASALGIFPGLTLPIYDADNTESVTVAPSYVQGSTTVPLVAALAHNHASGSAVSALPPAVKKAVVDLTSWMIKTRGASAMVISSINGGPSKQQNTAGDSEEDYQNAVDALEIFKRVR
jgi:hypothetical protein